MSYLNYNSTCAPLSRQFNISDIGYEENIVDIVNVNRFKSFIKQFVSAPVDSEVIFNSGATESIANMILWNKLTYPYGAVVGTSLDHEAVKINCKNFDVPYKILKKTIPKNTSMIFLTHVSGRTGEFLNISSFMQNLSVHSEILPLRALKVLDASQSIGKLPIRMDEWGLDAVFFSLHKIGGPMNLGVLVVRNSKDIPFIPLIGGKQQKSLRGGTLNLSEVTNLKPYFKNTLKTTKKHWLSIVKYLKDEGINVVEPSMQHLHNTILIKTKDCPLGAINNLANKGIYVGGISACSFEKMKENDKEGGKDDSKDEDTNYIRLSYSTDAELSLPILKTIVEVMKKHKIV